VVNRLLRALSLAADEGTGVLLVEQHLHVALDICDEVCFLKLGRVLLRGNAAELKSRQKEIQDIYL
jgi:branched-chain amino acid transport system ATP-binding protein